MSYCVECGVKLANYEKDCPLCATPVYNPNEIRELVNKNVNSLNNSENEYMCSDWVDDLTNKAINIPFLASIIIVCLMIPSFVVAVILKVVTGGFGWPMFVLGALACIWVYAILPCMYSKLKPYVYAIADVVISAIYLLVVNYCTGFYPWYLPLGLPLIILIGVVSVMIIYIVRRKDKRRIEKVGWIVLIGACLSCGIDIIVTHFRTSSFLPGWALYVSIPLIVLGIVLLIIARSVTLSEWLRRNLFI